MSAAEAVEAELVELGALDTTAGQLALDLAQMVDRGSIGDSQGAAGNAKQCEALMEALRARFRPKELGQLDLIRGGQAGSAKSGPRRSAASRRSAPTDREHAPRRARKAE